MPFNFKMLKAATLSVGTTTVYTVQAPATSAIVSNVRFHNPNASSATADVRVKVGADSFTVELLTIASSGGQGIMNKELTLALGQSVEITVASNTVDCLLSGVERV